MIVIIKTQIEMEGYTNRNYSSSTREIITLTGNSTFSD
jgi:hypothetical protein